jgi:hypothetical protein
MALCIVCGIEKEKLWKNQTCGNSCKAKLENSLRKKVICSTCEYEFTETQLSTHVCRGINFCENCGKRLERRKGERFCSIKCSKQTLEHELINKPVCIFCKKECKNHNSVSQHQARCKLNPERKILFGNGVNWTPELRAKHSEIMKKAYVPHIMTDEEKIKNAARLKEINKTMWTEEKRLEHGKIMQRVAQENPESYKSVGYTNTKREIYIGKNGDEFLMRSSWEVAMAKLLDNENINWTNKVDGFLYEFENVKHNYFPDFHLIDYDIYIEVKGIKIEKDEAKWNQFPKPLIKFMKSDYDSLLKNNYDIHAEIKKVNH